MGRGYCTYVAYQSYWLMEPASRIVSPPLNESLGTPAQPVQGRSGKPCMLNTLVAGISLEPKGVRSVAARNRA